MISNEVKLNLLHSSVIVKIMKGTHLTTLLFMSVYRSPHLPRSTNVASYLMLPAISVTNLPRSGGTLFTSPDCRGVDNTRWSEILVENSGNRMDNRWQKDSRRRTLALILDLLQLSRLNGLYSTQCHRLGICVRCW